MGKPDIFKPLLVLLGLVWGSSTGFAQTVVNVQDTSCSGIQSSSLNSPLSLNCSGDFSLNRGVLSDGSGIFLSATGALTLDNITISAPTIQFDAGTSISVGGNVSVVGSNISFVSSAAGTSPLLFSRPTADNLAISAGGAAGTLSITQSGTLTIAAGTSPLLFSPLTAGNLAISAGGAGTLSIAQPGNALTIAVPRSGTREVLFSSPLTAGNITIQAAPVINGQDFSIFQPSASSAVLNRVTGSAPSALVGTLTLNGLFLSNSNGVLAGQPGMVGVMPISAVPEPGSYATILAGLLCLAGFQRVRRKV